MEKLRRIPLSVQIVIGMAIGLVIGPLLGERAAPLGELGKLVIQLIKAVATPLLFFSIVNAILTSPSLGRGAVRMLGLALFNAAIALGIGLALSNAIKPGRLLAVAAVAGQPAAAAATTDKKVDVLKTLSGYVPSNLVTPFTENLVLSVVLLALLFGFAVRALRRDAAPKAQVIEQVVGAMLGVTEIVLGWVVRLIPLAVFGVVAKVVGEFGFQPLKGLGVYVAVALAGMALHIGVTYQLWIAFGSRIGLRRFWGEAKEPMIYAAGANSSLATLPLTLRALHRLGVSRSASALGACVGTNFNNDGILLYEAMAVLFVAQAQGLDLSLGQQLVAAGACMVAAMGVAGVPEAGIISLALVLNTVGLPLGILPLLLTVDWIIGRARSVTNVLSDMLLSILLDRSPPAEAAAPTTGSPLPG